MFSTIISGGIIGITSFIAQVEVDIAKTMPGFDMVGKLAPEVREARERVRVALKNSGILLPPVHVTVNISPADIRKDGTAYDLPIAIGILVSLGHLPMDYVKQICIVGELGLNGEIKPVRGILPMVIEARKNGIHSFIVPYENAKEGAVVQGINVIGAKSFSQVVQFLQQKEENFIHPTKVNIADIMTDKQRFSMDFSDIVGQEACKRAAVVAAAGFHHFLITGPPGSGKTMIAKCMPTILPELSEE